MVTTITGKTTFEVWPCSHCGMEFAVTESFAERARDTHESIYCPVGHAMSFSGQTEIEKERARAKKAEKLLERRERQLTQETQAHRTSMRKLAAQKGANTRLKNRIAAGVCPVCDESLKDLEKHMASEHPGFAEADLTADSADKRG